MHVSFQIPEYTSILRLGKVNHLYLNRGSTKGLLAKIVYDISWKYLLLGLVGKIVYDISWKYLLLGLVGNTYC